MPIPIKQEPALGTLAALKRLATVLGCPEPPEDSNCDTVDEVINYICDNYSGGSSYLTMAYREENPITAGNEVTSLSSWLTYDSNDEVVGGRLMMTTNRELSQPNVGLTIGTLKQYVPGIQANWCCRISSAQVTTDGPITIMNDGRVILSANDAIPSGTEISVDFGCILLE